MNKKKLVVIGNGMAGVNTIEHIIKIGGDRYDITIFGSEPYPNYNRILLSSVLAGEADMNDIVLNSWSWYEENDICLHSDCTVTKIDAKKKIVYTDTKITASYDELIIATGSLPFMLPLPGIDKEGVIAFRDIKDCEAMIEASTCYKKAVVIGGGLLGLEAARGLLHLGMEVTVVHLSEHLMNRQLDPTASAMLHRELKDQGMKFLLYQQTEEILGSKRVTGLRFTDGTVIDADLVVMAVGIRPNVQVAEQSGIKINRGIVVNDYMQTSENHIYAVGECTEHRGIAYGLVAPLYEQGAVLAKHLCGVETAPYEGSVTATKLKVSGVDVFSAGEFMEQPGTRAIRVHDEWNGMYKKVLVKDDKIVGGVLFGDTSESSRLFQWIRNRTEMTAEIHASLLGLAASGTKTGDNCSVAALGDDELICGCNGVSKGAIISAIQEKGLTTLEEVKGCTGASRSCGGCKPLVSQVLEHVLGEEFDSAGTQKEGLCSCTALTRDEVVTAIQEKHLTHIKEVMNVLEWNTTEGCSKCRPALNYYLGMIWPKEYEDDRHSRFVNEKVHANIQKDGTYSVVPRMYGGVTSAEELRLIADVAEKYNVQMIKVTGGQRLDLLGIAKEDLPRIWAELKMPSGYAYAKAVRTVKTCVGETFCRFGTQNSIQMGIDMEKKYERLNTPAKVKMAVSACPRNCAESGIKDLGVVGVDGGWEIFIGGNGGVLLRKADLLCKVKTQEEVLEITGAYLQYYRETGQYGERTSEWVERMGLEQIKKAIVDDIENRKHLLERIEVALEQLSDPWEDIVADPNVRQTLFEEIKL